MERRFAERKRAKTKVFLHHPELPDTPCVTRDMSEGGFFVELSAPKSLTRGTRLGMTFAVDLGSVTNLYQLNVVVAQISGDGIGLSVDRLQTSQARTANGPVNSRADCAIVPLIPKPVGRHQPERID